MKDYFKLYGPLNGIACVVLGITFFLCNVLMLEYEGMTIRLLAFAPVPLVLSGISLVLFPGARLTRQQVHDDNVAFWAASPNLHKLAWVVVGVLWVAFLVVQVLSYLGGIDVPVENCFLSNYLGIGTC